MSLVEILLLGLALSMDAFAVTLSNSFAYAHEPRSRLVLMPVFFGLFQGLMPVAGYFAGSLAASFIERFAGPITLVILGIIGGNMIREGVIALRHPEGEAEDGRVAADKHLTIRLLVVQAVATSIDAFAVGVSLLASGANIALAGGVIALTTFLCCLVALAIGKRFGTLLGDRAQVAGGIVLVAIGIKAMFF